MTKKNNRTVLDLSKVQHGSFYYVNQWGQWKDKLPMWTSKIGSGYCHTVRGDPVFEERLAHPHPDYPGETELARGKRLNIIDVWTPVVTFQLTANHNIQFTGDKAIAMWGAWKARIFGKKDV